MSLSRWMRANALLAALAGLALRLFFVFQFPSTGSGDAPFYIELAWNWIKNGVYGFPVNGQLTPVDMRVPGYPAFLAAVFTLAGRSERAVMLAQAALDLGTCCLIALIAATLAPKQLRRRVAIAGLWLAAFCPFTANYTAVVLTETLVVFLTALATLLLLQTQIGESEDVCAAAGSGHRWFFAGIIVGFGTLVRPETPLLLIAGGIVLVAKWRAPANWPKLLRASALLGCGLLLPLLPWAARNWRAFHEVQFLAPRYSELPGEIAPVGFNAWTGSWLWRFRDVYLTTWKLDDESISLESLPGYAFDSATERERVTDLLDGYNQTLTLSRSEDQEFGAIAHERTARHPLRTYLKIPLLRTLTIWFTPRVELLPYSGRLWPISERWNQDPDDFLVTLALVLANGVLIGLALAGAWIARGRPGWTFLILFIGLRTLFFAVFVEAPEPRYVLECFPAVLALAAQVWSRNRVRTGDSSFPQAARDGS